MISHLEASLSHFSIHKIGNKLQEEQIILSEQPFAIKDEMLSELLMQYFLTPFEKVNEAYRFWHATGNLELNEMFHFAAIMFDDTETFHNNTIQIARQLYDITNHPKIKSGELYICYFNKLQIEGELLDAIGIFKSESKEPFLTITQQGKTFELGYEQEAINIKKLDKGCIIFNTEKSDGFKVVVVDQTNRSEAVYWIDDFLKLKVRNDNYNQTQNVLSVYKSFVTDHMEGEFEVSKTDKIELLNRSIKYFKENENFELEEFGKAVIRNPQGLESFKQFKNSYEDEFDTEIADSFEISNAAVKKQARVFKSILKLDKNFHIYIHGSKEMIERGFDEEKNLNYYKVYFREEQ